jgi:hypothetical protein
MDGYQVEVGALAVTADGIQSVLDELGHLGINGEQESGSPIENVALSAEDIGSMVLAQLTADGLERAHYALRTALANATQMAGALREVQAAYQRTDSGVAGVFGQITHDIADTARRATPDRAPRPVTDRQVGSDR